jgi:hypothetical protein
MSRPSAPISDRRDGDTTQTLNPLAAFGWRFGGERESGADPTRKFGVMRRLDFTEASKIIKAVDADLEAALNAVWIRTARTSQSSLCFFLAKYPYKHFVVKNGQALDPDGRPLGADLLLPNRLPVGLILDNLLEVVDDVIRKDEVIEFPQALLFKHQLIGLWELIDQLLNVEGRPEAKWTISSGSRSLKFLEFPTQKVQWDRLRARYRQLSTYDKTIARKLKEMDLIQMVGEVDRRSKQWVTQILYFSSAWFNELERQLGKSETAVHATKLFSYLQNTSWETLARVRYNDDQLTDALTEWGGDSNVVRCKAAYLLLRHSLQVLTQRRPCFAPVDGTQSNLGPLDTLKEDLLGVARLNQTVLGPMYLHAGQVGLLSLSQLVPSAFSENPEDNLEYIFRIISRARDAAAKRNVSVPALDDLPKLFASLSFRVKSGRRRQKGRHGSVLTFKVKYSPSIGGGYEREDIPIEMFYEPLFSADNLPTSDSRFFRVAMKLDRTSDSGT